MANDVKHIFLIKGLYYFALVSKNTICYSNLGSGIVLSPNRLDCIIMSTFHPFWRNLDQFFVLL